jgi:hypothetical protein
MCHTGSADCLLAGSGFSFCPKHVEFYSKNKFEKLVHLVGFIIRKSKAIPLQAWEGPEGSRGLRLPDFMKIGT